MISKVLKNENNKKMHTNNIIKKLTKKKTLKGMIALLIVFSMLLSPFSMGFDKTAEAKAKVKLNKKKITLKVGKTYKLKLKNAKKKAKITWKSSNKKIVKVTKKGKITAKKKGNAVITAKYKFKGKVTKYKCKVTVKKNNSSKTTSPTASPASTEAVVLPTPQIIYIYVTPTPSAVSESAEPVESAEPIESADSKESTEPVESAEPTESVDPQESAEPQDEGNLTYQGDVTYDMTKASYWINKCNNPNEVMIDKTDIEAANKKMLFTKECTMNDLINMSESFKATNVKKNLANSINTDVKVGRVASRSSIWLDGEKVTDLDTYFQGLYDNIINAETSDVENVKYGLCVKRADVKMAPEKGAVGWSKTDADDEFNNSAIKINEPVVIKATTADKKFYFVYTNNCTGWVESDKIAVCSSKSEWEEMWNIPVDSNDLLVVTGSRITLQDSNFDTTTAKLELTLGTHLPLVPEDEMPENIYERGTWYNYVCYVPTRDDEGNMVKAIALIPIHSDVNVGYLPFTKKNILNVAFSCLGERYGWGGMLDAWDCSLFTRDIYSCFGFEIPRNTTWQTKIPSDNIVLSGMTDEEKTESILSCEPGTLLMFSGHITMYIGEENGKPYVISDLGSLAEAKEYDETCTVKSQYVVAVNSLNVRRKNGSTWLSNLSYAIRPWDYEIEE